MYSAPNEKVTPPADTAKYIRIGIVAAIGLIIFAIVGNQGVILSMNFSEFGEKFTKPLFYAVVSAIILPVIALVRVNIIRRSSIFWFGVKTAISFLGSSGSREPITNNIKLFRDYKLSPLQFVIWQITKVLLFGAFFVNVMFGFAAMEFIDGNTLGIENLPILFSLPFVTPPMDSSYAMENVIPMVPVLVILLPAILAVIGLRLVLYVGLHTIINVATSYIHDTAEGKPRYLNYVSSIEAVIGIGILWG